MTAAGDAFPPVHVRVRATIDWSDERAVDALLIPEFRPKRELWDATFAVPYHRFRHRLKLLAEDNLARIRGATVGTGFDGLPAGAIVVPVDDDDWFAPDLVDRLRSAWDADPAAPGWHWPQRVLEARPAGLLRAGRRPVLAGEHTRWLCGSNSYAVRWSGRGREAVASHVEASRMFEAESARVRRIEVPLGLQNRNLSSQTVLGWRRASIPRRTLLRRWRRYRRLYRRVALPPAMAWAREPIERMGALMDELVRRRERSRVS